MIQVAQWLLLTGIDRRIEIPERLMNQPQIHWEFSNINEYEDLKSPIKVAKIEGMDGSKSSREEDEVEFQSQGTDELDKNQSEPNKIRNENEAKIQEMKEHEHEIPQDEQGHKIPQDGEGHEILQNQDKKIFLNLKPLKTKFTQEELLEQNRKEEKEGSDSEKHSSLVNDEGKDRQEKEEGQDRDVDEKEEEKDDREGQRSYVAYQVECDELPEKEINKRHCGCGFGLF